MITAAALYLTIAAFAFVVVSFADETTEGERMTWGSRLAVAFAWPLFTILAMIDLVRGDADNRD